ncbi:hypothetical protein AJ80_00207 [Polytolypa hystricis UAMH7299]|uniref:Ergosterol biosynthetic protein 28 n=1 Tax=Polytolypa hystricis (strain UAMH7299) TaxID=1447883 RepID=A0A2B7Z3Z0_POLH7|nr:hypothetical protein AJ80_00207 [Polytolypa hystricis UAMH7299]
MSSLLLYLPQQSGLLPKWLFFVSVVSSLNSLQSYRSPFYASQLYNAAPPNALASRTFGTWTFLSCVIRMYGAYFIDEPHVYDLTMATYAVALTHFLSEWLVFGSAKAKGRFVSPLCVATGSLLWMVCQRSAYLE